MDIMEKYCKSCGRVFDDLNFKLCPYCGEELATRYGRQPIPRQLRHKVFKRDGYRCRECGASNDETSLEIDHIVPVARGGTNDIDNLQTLCRECNRMKYTDEWVGGETDLQMAENELESLKDQLANAKDELEQAFDPNEILDCKFKIKKLENEEIPMALSKVNDLINNERVSNNNKQKSDEQKQVFNNLIKEVYLELDYDVLLRLNNRLCNYLSIDTNSVEDSLMHLLKDYTSDFNEYEDIEPINELFLTLEPILKQHIYSFVYEESFEKLNTTTNTIYDLEDVPVLIILKDGTNLTSWDDVEWQLDKYGQKYNTDVLYVCEDLSNEYDLTNKYKGLKSLRSIEILGISDKTKSMKSMFEGCTSLVGISSLVNLDVSNVENMMSMFEDCESLFDLSGLKNWDISNVSNMSYMFQNCKSLENLANLKKWNIYNVKDMGYIFSGCVSLTNLSDLKNWFSNEYNILHFSDYSKIDLNGMFHSCIGLKNLKGLEKWNVSQVGHMAEMFKDCTYLTDISALKNWNVSNVKTMRKMFEGCSGIFFDGLTNLNPLSDWNVSNVTNMAFMFHDCMSLEDISALKNWNVYNVKKINSMFEGWWHLKDVSVLEDWKMSEDTYMDKMFDDCCVSTSLLKWYV